MTVGTSAGTRPVIRPPHAPAAPAPDFAAARRELRRQLAVLERTWAHLLGEAPGAEVPRSPQPASGRGRPGVRAGRLLSLAELEAHRDRLLAAIDRAGAGARAEGRRQAGARHRLEQMVADPAQHRFARITCAELGLPGCGAYQVRPRLGIIGMLAGWWEVKLSSGCP